MADAYQGSLESLNKKLADSKESQKLLTQLQRYLFLERRHLLRCVKHLYGFWQDPSHPDRVRMWEGFRLWEGLNG